MPRLPRPLLPPSSRLLLGSSRPRPFPLLNRPSIPCYLRAKHTVSQGKRPEYGAARAPTRDNFLVNPHLCSGCGILLQDQNPNVVGFIYRVGDATKDRAQQWEKKTFHDVYDEIVRECNEVLGEKLQNTDEKTKALEKALPDETESAPGEESKPASKTVPGISYGHLRLRKVHSGKAKQCRRCHELKYHHNRLPHLTNSLPKPLPIEALLSSIRATNTDPLNPPLLVIVLDPVDFPLSFFPFTPPSEAQVLFVVNRADALCERASSMKHLRRYFELEIRKKLDECKMEIASWRVRCVSAKKGYGIKELIEDIFTMRGHHSNVYFLGITNVGKSSVVAAMVNAFGQQRDHLAPTASIYPRTTLGNVQLPVDLFMRPGTRTYSRACVFDTPGLEGDQAFLQSFIDVEYERAVSLIKVGGFQRPADKMTPVLGGLIRIDLLECEPHPNEPDNNHIRITAFTNLPGHITSDAKASLVFAEPPSSFYSRKSKIEIVTSRAMSDKLAIALEAEINSTGNSERNALEIVFAGMGFVAIGGNFLSARLRVWTPEGRGVGVRKPIVHRIQGGFSLDTVRKPKWGRLILLSQRKSVGAVIPEKFRDDRDVFPVGTSWKEKLPHKKGSDEVQEENRAII